MYFSGIPPNRASSDMLYARFFVSPKGGVDEKEKIPPQP